MCEGLVHANLYQYLKMYSTVTFRWCTHARGSLVKQSTARERQRMEAEIASQRILSQADTRQGRAEQSLGAKL